MINKKLKEYIEGNIIVLYKKFDKGHNEDHVTAVIDRALTLSEKFININKDMIYASAAYHDVGLITNDRKNHHIESAKFVRSDINLQNFFSKEEIDIIASACEEHRSSSKNKPSSVYGCIISDADGVDPIEIMIKRAYEYAQNYYNEKEQTKEELYSNIYSHLCEKYGYGGYCTYHLKESYKVFNKKEIEDILINEEIFKEIYNSVIRK